SAGEMLSVITAPPRTTSAGSRMLPVPRTTAASRLNSQNAIAPLKTIREYEIATARAPTARATAAATPPPMPPADMVCISMISGNTRATPASASAPSQPTNIASAALTTACTAMTTTLGAARLRRVGTMGPCSNWWVSAPAGLGGAATARSAISTVAISAALGLRAPQRHAGRRRARDEAVLRIQHVALDQADGVPSLDHPPVGSQRARPHRFQEVDLELERGERLALVKRAGQGRAHGGVGDVTQHAAVHRAHRVGQALVDLQLDRGLAVAHGREGEAQERGNGRRGLFPAQHHPGVLEHRGHRSLPWPLRRQGRRSGFQVTLKLYTDSYRPPRGMVG